LYAVHNSGIAGSHGRAVGAAIGTVAKRKAAPTILGEQR